jgi:hypothetical protein
MKERRKAERLKELNRITVSVIPGKENLPAEKIYYNYSDNFSPYGAKIRGNFLLPINTLLKIDFTLNTLNQQITVIGKVKWNKTIIENNDCEAGVEFVDTPGEEIQKIKDYMSWKQKSMSLNPFNILISNSAKFNETESD